MLLAHMLLQLINTSVTPPIQSTFVATWLGAVIASSIAMFRSHMTVTVRVAAKGAVTAWPVALIVSLCQKVIDSIGMTQWHSEAFIRRRLIERGIYDCWIVERVIKPLDVT
jgi:hypothetical protein